MSSSNSRLIQQGAEAKIFLDEKDNLIIKDRISKSYRISELDKRIIKQRTKAETKLLTRANQIINSPLPEKSKEHDKIIMPFIQGEKLSTSLNDFSLEKQKQVLNKIGESVAKLHKADIIHGDLTTSNMILVNNTNKDSINVNSKGASGRNVNENIDYKFKLIDKKMSDNNFQIFFIDFGLGYISKKVEDKAVDLHLLKQALEAKHFQHWKELFQEFQDSYSKDYPESNQIFERMIAIERRGRYRH
jgi:tRNA A-37 threonylcarbamoyl transferase component Bud32